MNSTPEHKLINKVQLTELLGTSYPSISRWIEAGLIPPPIKLTTGTIKRARCYWWEHEVISFLEKASAETAKLEEAKNKRRAEQAEKEAKFLAAIGCI